MLVLGLDTATRTASIGLTDGEKLFGEFNLSVDRVHSKRLMPMIDRLVKESGHSISDVQGIAVSSGPGSFTGLRIGMATAKGLAFALSVPLVGVSTLKALCWNCAPNKSLLCPILDARMKEYYTAIYGWKDDKLESIVSDAVMDKEDLIRMIASTSNDVIVIADSVVLDALSMGASTEKSVLRAPFSQVYPRGSSIAALGYMELQQGASDRLLTLQPAYIRRSQAEIMFDKNKRRDQS